MFALVDCNNFYVSCERVFNPKLTGRPVIVLSNNDGCAIARSEEAKAIGIEMGAAFHLIRDIIQKHKVAVYSSNYTLYADMSARVHETLRMFAPRLEAYSIDEAFLDLSNRPHHDLTALALEIKAAVLQNTGIPVSIGIAPTKTLAKMANRYAKKVKREVGVHAIRSQEEIDEILRYTKIGDVWGIGRQHNTRLQAKGVNTAYELLKINDDWMRKNMTVVGQRLLNELKGLSCIPLTEFPKAKKNICSAKSFGKLLTELPDIQQAVANYAATVAHKLREQKSCAKKIFVFIQTNPFRKQDQQRSVGLTIPLIVATGNTQEINDNAQAGLKAIYKSGYNYHKAGIMVLDIIPETEVQQAIVDKRQRVKENQVCKTMDGINACMGRDAVRFAAQGGEKKVHAMRREYLSQGYTTRINEVPVVKAK